MAVTQRAKAAALRIIKQTGEIPSMATVHNIAAYSAASSGGDTEEIEREIWDAIRAAYPESCA